VLILGWTWLEWWFGPRLTISETSCCYLHIARKLRSSELSLGEKARSMKIMAELMHQQERVQSVGHRCGMW
jgi:hypothetical protein